MLRRMAVAPFSAHRDPTAEIASHTAAHRSARTGRLAGEQHAQRGHRHECAVDTRRLSLRGNGTPTRDLPGAVQREDEVRFTLPQARRRRPA